MFDLKGFRELHNLTQKELADIIGVTSVSISNAEKGRISTPHRWVDILKEKYPNYIWKDSILAEPKQHYGASNVKQISHSEFQEVGFLSITAQAGYLNEISENQQPMIAETMLVPKEYEKGNYLIVEISGDSMSDGFRGYMGYA